MLCTLWSTMLWALLLICVIIISWIISLRVLCWWVSTSSIGSGHSITASTSHSTCLDNSETHKIVSVLIKSGSGYSLFSELLMQVLRYNHNPMCFCNVVCLFTSVLLIYLKYGTLVSFFVKCVIPINVPWYSATILHYPYRNDIT